MKNNVFNFFSNSVKIPWILGKIPGLFIQPEFLDGYKTPIRPFNPYSIILEEEKFRLIYNNPGFPLDANELHILQGLLYYEKPFDISDPSQSSIPLNILQGLTIVRTQPLPQPLTNPLPPQFFQNLGMSYEKVFDPSFDYMITKDNVIDFNKKIGSKKATLPFEEQLATFDNSLKKLLNQQYILTVPQLNAEPYVDQNNIIHTIRFESNTGNFEVVRKIPKPDKPYHEFIYEIDFNEIQLIESDSTRILHHVICAYIPPGETMTFPQLALEKQLRIHSELVSFDGKVEYIDKALSELMKPGIDWEISRDTYTDGWTIYRNDFSSH